MNDFYIRPAGDSAILIQLGSQISPTISRRVHGLASRILEHPPVGLREAVPGYASLLLHFDPLTTTAAEISQWADGLAASLPENVHDPQGRRVEIPIVYDGPDLVSLAKARNLDPKEVIRLHAGQEYLVYLIGFTPGFAYLGEVDERIAAPRLATPRKVVPAGSVGIAGRQTGVYPIDSPGGWQLIGRTHLRFFDLQRGPPCLLAPGDTVQFLPVEALP